MIISGIGIIVVQLIDLAIHAATHQLEPLRISSNIIILLGLASMASGRFKVKSLPLRLVPSSLILCSTQFFLSLTA